MLFSYSTPQPGSSCLLPEWHGSTSNWSYYSNRGYQFCSPKVHRKLSFHVDSLRKVILSTYTWSLASRTCETQQDGNGTLKDANTKLTLGILLDVLLYHRMRSGPWIQDTHIDIRFNTEICHWPISRVQGKLALNKSGYSLLNQLHLKVSGLIPLGKKTANFCFPRCFTATKQ